LTVEHITPEAYGGTSDEDNLWLSCRNCNEFKGSQTHARNVLTGRRVRLFHPRRQKWSQHFAWSEDGTRIIGKTACGRATVDALRMNNITVVTARQHWVRAGLHPPDE
jgi:hypothetical protein